MKSVRRAIVVAALVAAGGSALTAPAFAATTPSFSLTVAGVPCSNITELGTKKVVADLGMSAFTVRQFKGYCRDAKGSSWMNFGSVYVWQQYHARGFSYQAYAGIATLRINQESIGFVVGANRQRLTFSTPVRTIPYCTQGWGKLYRSGAESSQGLTSEVC